MPSQEMTDLIERIRSAVPFTGFSVDAHRERVERAESMVPAEPGSVVRAEEVGGVPCEWISTGRSDPQLVLVLLHHGAFVAGSSRSLHSWGARLADAAGVMVLAPNYRLAPESPFPAAVEDAVSCYEALLERGHRPADVVLGGTSAGGGIAAAALLALRDGGRPLPAGGLLVCPLLDTTLSSAAMRAEVSAEPIDSRPISGPAVALYLDGTSPEQPLASPVLADLSGLPPLHLEAAGADRLVDDATSFAARGRVAGVDLGLTVTAGAIHNFPQSGPHTPEAVEATDRVVAFLGAVLAPAGGAATGRDIPTAERAAARVD